MSYSVQKPQAHSIDTASDQNSLFRSMFQYTWDTQGMSNEAWKWMNCAHHKSRGLYFSYTSLYDYNFPLSLKL